MPEGTKSPFFAGVSREKVIFACSLEKNVPKKIREDLRAAAAFQEKVGRMVFLSSEDVPVGKRHTLQKLAVQEYDISLDIFDARAISDWLSEPELFWIAQQYLSMPSDFVLAVPKGHRWYEEVLHSSVDAAQATESDFYNLKDAVRSATHDPAYLSDLPRLLEKLRAFRGHRSVQIQRRAFYEEFVAALRGLGDVRGLEEALAQYISNITLSDDPFEVEDGSVLIGYAVGAQTRGLLNVEMSTIAEWKKSLLTRVEVLLSEPGISPGRQCALMSTQGFLLLLTGSTAAVRRSLGFRTRRRRSLSGGG